jgi:hypothetical protein
VASRAGTGVAGRVGRAGERAVAVAAMPCEEVALTKGNTPTAAQHRRGTAGPGAGGGPFSGGGGGVVWADSGRGGRRGVARGLGASNLPWPGPTLVSPRCRQAGGLPPIPSPPPSRLSPWAVWVANGCFRGDWSLRLKGGSFVKGCNPSIHSTHPSINIFHTFPMRELRCSSSWRGEAGSGHNPPCHSPPTPAAVCQMDELPLPRQGHARTRPRCAGRCAWWHHQTAAGSCAENAPLGQGALVINMSA